MSGIVANGGIDSTVDVVKGVCRSPNYCQAKSCESQTVQGS